MLTSAITALISSLIGAIVAALITKFKTVTKDSADMREMQRKNLTMTCRIAIYDEHFSVEEKLDAYIIYRDTCHGNHQTKRYMDELIDGDVDEYLETHRKKD